jgi:ketosteroid isomerase-like protein
MTCKNGKTPIQIVKDLLDAYSRHDVDAASAMLAPDFKRYGDPDMTIPWNKEQYHAMWLGFCEAFPDFKFELTNYVENKNTVVVEMIESGTFTQPFPGIMGKSVAPSGKYYKDWDCAWYEINEDGLATEARAYLTNNFSRINPLTSNVEELEKPSEIFS